MSNKKSNVNVAEDRNSFENVSSMFPSIDSVEEAPMFGTDGSMKLVVRKTLSFGDAIEFVADIVDACVGENSEYIPEGFDMALRLEVFTKYGNFFMPDKMNTAYDVLYCTPIYEQILSIINMEQFTALRDAALKKIEFRATMSASMASTKMNELLAKMDDIANTSANVFAGIDSEQMNKLMGNIAGLENIDEKSIAKAFVQELAAPKRKPRAKKNSSKTSSDTIVIPK